MDAAPFSGFVPYIVEYSIITPILLFLGGVVGWISGESVRIKLFALGVSAPALITTWSPASPLGKVGSAEDILVPSAYAASVSAVSGYLVQIGAFSARDLALRLASGINAKVGSARAFVTEDPADRVTPFRVRVLSNMSFSAALALRQDLLKTGLIKDAIVVDLSRDQH